MQRVVANFSVECGTVLKYDTHTSLASIFGTSYKLPEDVQEGVHNTIPAFVAREQFR